MFGFNLDPKAAMAGDQHSSRIDETGWYDGIFTRVEPMTNKNGFKVVEFTFRTNSGQLADLEVATHDPTVKPMGGLNVMHAILACMRVRSTNPVPAAVEKWENGQRVTKQVPVLPELMNKSIGLLLERENYEKNDGTEGFVMRLFGPFDASTRMTATEILKGATAAEMLDKMIPTLKDRQRKKKANASQPNGGGFGGGNGGNGGGNYGGGFGDFDDDIPF